MSTSALRSTQNSFHSIDLDPERTNSRSFYFWPALRGVTSVAALPPQFLFTLLGQCQDLGIGGTTLASVKKGVSVYAHISATTTSKGRPYIRRRTCTEIGPGVLMEIVPSISIRTPAQTGYANTGQTASVKSPPESLSDACWPQARIPHIDRAWRRRQRVKVVPKSEPKLTKR